MKINIKEKFKVRLQGLKKEIRETAEFKAKVREAEKIARRKSILKEAVKQAKEKGKRIVRERYTKKPGTTTKADMDFVNRM